MRIPEIGANAIEDALKERVCSKTRSNLNEVKCVARSTKDTLNLYDILIEI